MNLETYLKKGIVEIATCSICMNGFPRWTKKKRGSQPYKHTIRRIDSNKCRSCSKCRK